MYRADDRDLDASVTSKCIRVAIYCRVSTEEGLHLEFNSLHAQREACEAYIRAQLHEGWSLAPGNYDDGGFSGGTLERPALKRLLANIAIGQVDVVVVYKIDRLTRSLADFAKIVDVLDNSKASFASVTQQFNTTSSMGRLTLNVLLSFAQFEREVGAERVRDKIAASKKKGMWMGGVCPLGYDVVDRKLIVNEKEAETVRSIFNQYVKLGSVIRLETELERQGVQSKRRHRYKTPGAAARPITRGALYNLLQNRIYVGMICHRGTAYTGRHDAIVSEHLFAEAQEMLASNRAARKFGTSYSHVAVLAGLVRDPNGRPMSPTHTTKGAARYRYYASKMPLNGEAPPTRVAAADLERVVLRRITQLLGSEFELHGLLEPRGLDAPLLQALLRGAKRAEGRLKSGNQGQVRELLLNILSQAEIQPEQVTLRLRLAPLIGPSNHGPSPSLDPLDCRLTFPCRIFRRGREIQMAIVPDGPKDLPAKDPALIKLLTKAWVAREALMNGGGASLEAVAAAAGCDRGYFTVLVKLGFLAPSIISAILHGEQPQFLARQQLARIRSVPLVWEEQRRVLGFTYAPTSR